MILISPLNVVWVLTAPPLKVNPLILKGRSFSSETKIKAGWRRDPADWTPPPALPGLPLPLCAGPAENFSRGALGRFKPFPPSRGRRWISLMIIVAPAPAPCSVILLVIVSDVVQVSVPAGTVTMSPSFAAATAEPTSANDTLLAAIVAPVAEPETLNSAPSALVKSVARLRLNIEPGTILRETFG